MGSDDSFILKYANIALIKDVWGKDVGTKKKNRLEHK